MVQEEVLGCFALSSNEELRNRIHKLFDVDDQRVPTMVSSFFVMLPKLVYSKKTINNYNENDAIMLATVQIDNQYL